MEVLHLRLLIQLLFGACFLARLINNSQNMSHQMCGCLYKKDGLPVPVKSIDIQVSLSGFIASVTSKLTYKSDSETSGEAQFVFPLDDQSTVYRFEARIADRTIIGECQEKEEARETYNEAVSQGKSAMLLEEDDSAGDIFSCLLGNLPQNTDVIVEFAYVIELGVEADGGVKFCLPTVLNPRYNPSMEDGGTDKPPKIHKVESNTGPYDININVDVSGSKEIMSVSSEKDKWSVNYGGSKTNALLNLESKFTFDHDLDFIVYYKDPYTPHGMLAKGNPSKEGLLKENIMMLSFFPELKDEDFSNNHEFVIIVDRSESMGGSKMKNARETLLLILKSLPHGCYFNVVSFGFTFEALFPDGSQEYNKANLAKACELQSTMEANFGGTEILEPLRYVYNKPPMATHTRQIMLLTDGEVFNTQAVISLVKENAHNARMFSFGIGSGASTSLVKGVARAGRGKAEFISDDERMQTKVMKCLQSAMQASITELSLQSTDSTQQPIIIPTQLPPIFSGDKLVVYVLVPDVEKTSLKLTGKVGERSIEFTLQKPSLAVAEDFRFHRLATKAQIKELEASKNVDANKGNIVLLSRAVNIVSKFTSFVAVDKADGTKQNMISKQIENKLEVSPGYAGASHQILYAGATNMYAASYKGLQQVQDSTTYSDPAAIIALEVSPGYAGATNMYADSYKGLQQVQDSITENAADSDPAAIIALQKFDGSWDMSQKLSTIFYKPLNQLQEASTVKDQNLWATVLALAWLNVKWSSLKDEWMLAENKAVKWVELHLPADSTLDQLMQQAKTLF